MPQRFALTVLVLSTLVVGCGHAAKPAVTAHESDYDWSQYKGTASADAPAKTDEKADAKPDAKPADAKPDAKTDATASAAAPAADGMDSAAKSDGSALPHKPSKAKIHGESVSSVSADALAGASKTALKSKVVSSSVVVGPDYEMVQVVLKGASVQIIRPAATPDSQGPKLRSPKVRNDAMTTTESGWYDADADVIVLVRATKAGKSKKALGALLQH